MQGRIALFAAALVLGTPVAAAAQRDFDNPASTETRQQFTPGNVQREDTPNDPGYDRAEPDDEDSGDPSTNLYDERYDLFGFPSALTPLALYLAGPNTGKPQVSGFNAAGAWKLTRGKPEVAIAILDTGIKWDRKELRTKIRLSEGELPRPRLADGSISDEYDADGNGAFNVDDYKDDARVNPNAGTRGVANSVDAQDLIVTFSDGSDLDGNGYVDDIAGWDFFDDDNDPYDASSYFAASNHGSGRAQEAAADTNEGEGEPGVCPECQLLPIRIWDTFVSDANSFALGIVYAADNGVSVIEGANGSLYHSAFAEAASEYAYKKGVAQIFSGDDLNTGNHNYPANYDHTQLIQGVVTDTKGLGVDAPEPVKGLLTAAGIPLGSQLPVLTYFRGAGTTQYGGKSSISMEGATGSENTGKASGAAGLVVSAAAQHSPPIKLTPDETRAILEQTAEDVLPESTNGAGLPDAAQAGWDVHFGWGRANLGDAVSLAKSGKIPGEASIGSPDWYEPLAGNSVNISGLARARFATGGQFSWKLEWGPGLAPTTWNTVRTGSSGGTVTDFGSLPLAQIRQTMASYAPPVDPGMPGFGAHDPYKGQFTVRLTVDGEGIDVNGVDRKVLTVLDDPTLEAGFPKKLGTGGEAPIQNADVDGDNKDELIVPLEDGTVHVYGPDGNELDGWPVTTRPMYQSTAHASSPGLSSIGLPKEPTRGVAVADLDDDGEVELITTAGAHIYAWEPDGEPRDGFPVSIDRDNCRPQDQKQSLVHRKCGFLASPAVARLDGRDKPFSIVVPGLDGHLYAIDGDGEARPGFPKNLVDPRVPANEQMLAESINNVAISDLNGDGSEDVVVATNEVYGAEPPSFDSIAGGLAKALSDLLAQVTDTSTRVYAVNGKTGGFLPGWPIELNGGIQNTLPLIGPGHDPAILRVGNQDRILVSSTGGELATYDSEGVRVNAMEQSTQGPLSTATDKLAALNLFESAAVGDVLGTGRPAVVKYHTSLAGAANLLLVGQNFPWQHMIGAYDAQTGVTLPSFPAVTDDYQFLSSSTIAKVVPGETNQIVAGTGLGLLHAYDGLTGMDVEGFPKVTGGWLFAPAAIARDGVMSAITREGFLFRWKIEPERCQTEWPTFRHDQQHSGHYGRDGTPPGAASKLAVAGGKLTWEAPGDNGTCGTVTKYEVAASDEPIDERGFADATQLDGEPAPVQARSGQTMDVPGGSRYYAIRATDDVGNVGPVALLAATTGSENGPGETGGAGSGSNDGGSGGGSGSGAGPGVIAGPITSGGQPESCAVTAGFTSFAPKARGRGLSFGFSAAGPVDIDVLRVSTGRTPGAAKRVARFTGKRAGFNWNGKGSGVTDGYYELKVRAARETRRIALRRSHGRFRVLGLKFDRASCDDIALARMSRPVFGGPRNRAVALQVKLAKSGPVTVTVRRGRTVIRTLKGSGKTDYRFTLGARGLRRGDYSFEIRTASARTTLASRRL